MLLKVENEKRKNQTNTTAQTQPQPWVPGPLIRAELLIICRRKGTVNFPQQAQGTLDRHSGLCKAHRGEGSGTHSP